MKSYVVLLVAAAIGMVIGLVIGSLLIAALGALLGFIGFLTFVRTAQGTHPDA